MTIAAIPVDQDIAANDKPIATAPPSSPLIAPWSKKGAADEAVRRADERMIAISRLRCSTAMRIVVPMMMMGRRRIAAHHDPTAAASPRSRSSFSTSRDRSDVVHEAEAP